MVAGTTPPDGLADVEPEVTSSVDVTSGHASADARKDSAAATRAVAMLFNRYL
jgi:hypothetical protein